MTDDKIKPMIQKMLKFSEDQEYEKANEELISIYSELYKTKEPVSLEELLSTRRTETIKETFDYITGYAVRLSPDDIGLHRLLKLTIDANERIQKTKQRDSFFYYFTKRRIIAEEMVCNNITIPEKWKGKKPNRAFLDIALKVNPSLCIKEIERREKVKLWKALESGKEKDADIIKRKIKELREMSIK